MRYNIKNEEAKFFEMDFAGWSWQEDKRHARRFKVKQDAIDCVERLTEHGEKCEIVEDGEE